MKNLFLFLTFIIIFAACKDDDLPTPTTPSEPEVVCTWCPDSIIIDIGDPFAHPWGDTLVWQNRIALNGEAPYQSMSYKSAIVNGNFIEIPLFAGPSNLLRLKDGQTGNILWTWSHPSISGGSAISDLKVHNNYIVVNSTTRIYVVDGTSGETIWHSELSVDANNRIAIKDGILYHSLLDKDILSDTAYLVKTPVSTMKWDTIYKVDRGDSSLNGGSPFIGLPEIYTALDGSHYLISSVGTIHSSDHPYISFVRAYNQTTGEFAWTTEENGESPRLYQNKIYSFSQGYIKCFNPENGDLIWEQLISNVPGEGVQIEHCLTFYENYAIVKTMGELFMAFDTETGTKLWENAFKSHGPLGGLHVYQDKVYFMGHGHERIQGAHIATGELFMDWESPNTDEFHGASFSWSGVDVDTETGYLYVSDKYYTMCLDLNKIED